MEFAPQISELYSEYSECKKTPPGPGSSFTKAIQSLSGLWFTYSLGGAGFPAIPERFMTSNRYLLLL